MNRRYLIIGSIAAFTILGIVIIAILISQKLSTATIMVSAPSGSKVYAKQDNSDFKEIGTTTAKFTTQRSNIVIIEARLNGQVAQKPVQPQKNKTISVELQFQKIAEAKYFAPGPLTDLHIEGGFVYGVNPQTNNIAAFPITPSTSLAPTLPILPYLKDIIWQNSSNFLFVSLRDGSGQVVNNKREADTYYPYRSATGNNKDGILLIGTKDYFFTKTANTIYAATKIASFSTANTIPEIFSDSNYLYCVTAIYPKDGSEEAKETQFELFNNIGEKKNSFSLPLHDRVFKVTAINQNTLAILTANNLTTYDINTKQTTAKQFSFGKVQDMVMYKDKLLLLGSDGLWQYNYTADEYYKTATYPEHQEYTPGSLTVLDGSLYFSTSVSKEALVKDSGPNVRSGIYKVSF